MGAIANLCIGENDLNRTAKIKSLEHRVDLLAAQRLRTAEFDTDSVGYQSAIAYFYLLEGSDVYSTNRHSSLNVLIDTAMDGLLNERGRECLKILLSYFQSEDGDQLKRAIQTDHKTMLQLLLLYSSNLKTIQYVLEQFPDITAAWISEIEEEDQYEDEGFEEPNVNAMAVGENSAEKTRQRHAQRIQELLMTNQVFHTTYEVFSKYMEQNTAEQTFNAVEDHLGAMLLEDDVKYVNSSKACACYILQAFAVTSQTYSQRICSKYCSTLLKILSERGNAEILHSSVGLLSILSRAPESRSTLLMESPLDTWSYLFLDEQVDIRTRAEAICALRWLLTDNYDAIAYTLNAESQSTSSSRKSKESVLSKLLDRVEKSNLQFESSLIYECGELLVTLLRSLAQHSDGRRDLGLIQEHLYSHRNITLPLFYLIKQEKPDGRLHGLLGIGLLAQEATGANILGAALNEDKQMMEVFASILRTNEAPLCDGMKSNLRAAIHNLIKSKVCLCEQNLFHKVIFLLTCQ
jgi:hypothetical protein